MSGTFNLIKNDSSKDSNGNINKGHSLKTMFTIENDFKTFQKVEEEKLHVNISNSIGNININSRRKGGFYN